MSSINQDSGISFLKSNKNNSFDLIKISKEYKYVSDLPKSLTSQFDNCYIDKTLTGCGFTTWIIQNEESYIIAVPFKGLIDCKVSQSKTDKEMYPYEILPFYCNASETDLKQSLKVYLQRNKVKKIMVTYDSVPKLISYLEQLALDMKNFKLFIDEAHKILEFAGNFKANVITDLEQTYPKFKSVIAATATPTRCEYIPDSFSSFNKIKLDWELKMPVIIKHKNISQNEVRSTVQAFAYSHLNGDLEGNAYFFVNSVKFAVAITQSLIKIGFDRKHFNIICGKSETNDKLLKPLKLSNYNPLTEFCKINFITSTAFEGQDFMDPDGVIYVLSTGKLEHTKIDISTQLPQINGRLRCSKYKNKVNFIWSYAFTDGETNFDIFEEKTIEKDLDATASVPMFHTLTNMLKTFVIIGSQGDIWFLNDKNDRDELIKNPNAKNHLLNAFVGTQLQYFVHCSETDGLSYNELIDLTAEYVEYTLNDILGNKVESNLEVPELSASIKLKLNKVPNFSKLVKEYAEATIRMNMSTHGSDEWYAAASIVHSIRENGAYDDVVKYIETFGPEAALRKGYSTICNARIKERLEKSSNNGFIKDAIEKEFKPGDIIYIKDVKAKLQDVFDKHNITAKPKRAQLSLAFNVKASTYTDTETGIRYNVVKLYPK